MKMNRKNILVWVSGLLFILLIFLYRGNINFGQTETIQVTVITKSKYGKEWEAISQGIRAGANEYRVNVKILAPDSDRDVEAQKALLQTAATSGSHAIIIVPIDYDFLDETMNEINKKGIPVITMVSTDVRYLDYIYIGLDHYETGRRMGQSLIEHIGVEGLVAILRAVESTDDNILREKGIRDYLEGFSDIHIIETDENTMGEYSVAVNARELRVRKPKVDAFIGVDEASTRGLCTALKDDLTSQLVIGFGSGHEMIGEIERNVIDELIAPNYFAIGYMALKNAVEYLEHESFDDISNVEPIFVNLDNMYNNDVQKLLFPIE